MFRCFFMLGVGFRVGRIVVKDIDRIYGFRGFVF